MRGRRYRAAADADGEVAWGTGVYDRLDRREAALSREAGADEVIFYTKTDFAVEVKRLTNGRGLPVVYDSVGKTTFEQSLIVPAAARHDGAVWGGEWGGTTVRPDTAVDHGLALRYATDVEDYVATREDLMVRATDVMQGVADGSLKLRLEYTIR